MFGKSKNKNFQISKKDINSNSYSRPKDSNFSLILSTYDIEEVIKESRQYLESLSLEELVQESSRVSNFIEHGYIEYVNDDNPNKVLYSGHFVFPYVKNPKTGYTIDVWHYSAMVSKIIKERSEREKRNVV